MLDEIGIHGTWLSPERKSPEMLRTIDAIYENGGLRLLQPLDGVTEHAKLKVTVEVGETRSHPLADCIGILPDEDAQEMLRIIDDQFERVDPSEWQ